MRQRVATTILVIALGATVGAVMRYYITLWSVERFGAEFPYGTLLINVGGSFILGCFLTVAAERGAVSAELRLLVATGFCGSLTTFSTFSYEAVGLMERGDYVASALYMFGSLALGVVGVVSGAALVRLLP